MFIPANPTISIQGNNPSVKEIAESFPFKVGCVYPSARTALQSALKNRGLGKRVWLPAFMCRSLLKPLKNCGLNINYYDIDTKFVPQLSNLDFSPGDYLLVVHFFGILGELKMISGLCSDKGIFLIEDCAHILPDSKANCFAGKTGDISIFSFRKLLPVLYGGLAVEKTGSDWADSALLAPDINSNIKKKILMITERLAFISGFNIMPAKKMLRNLFGNTDSPMFSGKPDTVTYHIENYSANNIDIAYLQSAIRKRKDNYRCLYGLLEDEDKIMIPFPVLPDGSCPQFFPVLVKGRQDILNKLIRSGIEAIVWPEREIVPVSLADYPHTKTLVDDLLLLPVHDGLAEAHIRHIAGSLKRAIVSS